MPNEANPNETESSFSHREKYGEISRGKEKFEPTIPRGWTTLYHGTNMIRWQESPADTDNLTIKHEMSAVSQRMRDRDMQDGSDSSKSYSSSIKPSEMSDLEYQKKNIQFEIRVIALDDLVHFSSLNPDLAESLTEEESKILRKIYQPRHAMLPNGLVLLKLGQTEQNGRPVYYFIPKIMADRYIRDCQ